MADSIAPPIFLSFSSNLIPIADDNPDENRKSFLTILIVFLSLIFLYFLRIPLWKLVSERIPYFALDEAHRIKEEANAEQNAQRFISNFHSICWTMIALSISFKDIREKPSKILPWCFILLWIVSITVIHRGIGQRQTISEGYSPPILNQNLAQAGLIIFFISVNGYLIDRIMAYYKDKTDLRKKAEFARVGRSGADGSITDTISIQHFHHPRGPRSMSIQSQDAFSPQLDPALSSTQTEMIDFFDKFFNYKRRMKHLKPQFNNVRFTFTNMIQILILVTEFIQLASFPMRDLLRNEHFQNAIILARENSGLSFINGIRSLVSTISSGLPAIHTRFLANIQFAFAWWLVILGCCIAAIFMTVFYILKLEFIENSLQPRVLHNMKRIVSGSWILNCLPLINLLYLVILSAFIDPLGCFSDNTTPLWPASSPEFITRASQDRINQCFPIREVAPVMYTSYALSGFMAGYFLLTICRTAQEPVPTDGFIHYTSRSELINKNASLVLLLLYVLIPTAETTTIRGILAVFILAGMILYNVFIGCSYTRIVNFIRGVSFTWVLCMCAVVVYYTHLSNARFTEASGTQVFTVISVGWVILLVLYTLMYLFWIRGYQDESLQPRQPRSRQNSLSIPHAAQSHFGTSSVSESAGTRTADSSMTPVDSYRSLAQVWSWANSLYRSGGKGSGSGTDVTTASRQTQGLSSSSIQYYSAQKNLVRETISLLGPRDIPSGLHPDAADSVVVVGASPSKTSPIRRTSPRRATPISK